VLVNAPTAAADGHSDHTVGSSAWVGVKWLDRQWGDTDPAMTSARQLSGGSEINFDAMGSHQEPRRSRSD